MVSLQDTVQQTRNLERKVSSLGDYLCHVGFVDVALIFKKMNEIIQLSIQLKKLLDELKLDDALRNLK